MSTPGLQDASPVKSRGLARSPSRKAPPSPLAISSSTQSRLKPPPIPSDASPAVASSSTPSSSNNTGRNSLDSVRSDLASARSEITSLHVNEFPLPPSALPTIPASPRTPRSLHFSTTPRSLSPTSGFESQQHDPSKDVGASERGGAASPSRHGYDLPRDPGPARYSQYAIYKETNVAASASRPVTPATAGSATTRDWPSSSDQRSSLHPPHPKSETLPPPSSSPPQNAAFAKQQDEHQRPKDTSALPRGHPSSRTAEFPRNTSPQPPRLPLPVLPPRESRDSARYSHIARRAGVTDMGLDISEEDLLSTNFISELLNQPPAASSPRIARFTRLPDSPQSPSFLNIGAEETTGLSEIVDVNEISLAPGGASTLESPRFSGPQSISTSDIGVRDSTDIQVTGMESPTSASGDGVGWQPTKTRRMQSGLASSVYPSGGDRIVESSSPGPASPSFPVSPTAQTLTVPENRFRNHTSPHPLMPSTPMSRESFASATSPRSPRGFARAQANHLLGGQWRNPATSQSLAARLPIGARSPSSPTQSPISPRIRQHHYPRNGSAKRDMAAKGQNQAGTPLQTVTFPSTTANVAQPSASDKSQDASNIGSSAQAGVDPSKVTEIPPPAMSPSSSTRTQRDSAPSYPQTVEESPASDSLEGSSEESPRIPTTNIRRSVMSSYPGSADGLGENDSADGEIQTANRVWTTTSAGDEARPTVVGVAPAVILNQKSDAFPEAASTKDPKMARPVDVRPFDSYALVTPPASPHDPPSSDSPPAQRTDRPDSVKSLGLTEDVHGTKPGQVQEEDPPRLPYEEAVGYGSSIFLEYQGPASNRPSKNPLQRQQSNQATSFKSIVSYISNKSVSTVASKQSASSGRWGWLKRKPLPPLPSPSAPSVESEWSHVSQDPTYTSSLPRHKAGLPLSDPASGANNTMRVTLDQGSTTKAGGGNVSRPGQPQGWSEEYHSVEKSREWYEEPPLIKRFGLKTSGPKFEMFGEDSLHRTTGGGNNTDWNPSSKEFNTFYTDHNQELRSAPLGGLTRTRRRLWMWWPLVAVLIAAMVIAIALGATLGRKHSSSAMAGGCSGNMTGSQCNLNATCTCPASQSGTCSAPLAQALADLVPVTSQLFATNITNRALAVVLWEAQGTPIDQNCASQTNLIDVGSVLDSATLPNRTRWTQAALLWSLFQSGDIPATQDMQSRINKLPFQLLQKDGPQRNASNQFAVPSSGFIFNFASQTVEAPLVKFRDDASPSLAQLNELNSVAQSSLDRMYSYANASSTQRQTALSTYWESVLSLDLNDLPTFISVFKTASVLLPFDATASPGGYSISDILASATNRALSFPPSIACFPGLNTSQLQRISAVETQVYGLSELSSSPSTFDSTCFPSRPVYGVLDVLRTRLPFNDLRPGVAKQAAVLSSNASSRVVLRVGELLSALPAASDTELSAFNLSPRQFGTLSHMNHIVLDWLQAFSTTTDAMAAAKFLLSSPSSPPPPNSTLFNSTTLPVVEVAVFGDIFLSDLAGFATSFSTPSGGLFFGSSQGNVFRHWALQNSSQAIVVWAPSNFAPLIVREGSTPDVNFERIWSGAASLISNASGGVTGPSDVSKVTTAFFGS